MASETAEAVQQAGREKPANTGRFSASDEAQRKLSREVLAEGKVLGSNALCVAVRGAAEVCAGGICASASELQATFELGLDDAVCGGQIYSFRASSSWSTVYLSALNDYLCLYSLAFIEVTVPLAFAERDGRPARPPPRLPPDPLGLLSP